MSEKYPASSLVSEKFEKLLGKISTEFPDNEEAQQISVQICHRLRQEFENPLHEQLELVLRKRFTPDSARQLLFFPEPSDVTLYPLCIADAPDGAPKEHPQRKVQAAFLAVLYLYHIKSDNVFLVEFVQSGGIVVLSQMVNHPNLYIRGQVVESLTTITSSATLNWFEENDDSGKCATQKKYHPYLLALSNTNFVKYLVANLSSSFPGGSYLCLQLLGFWLSWIRLFYCEDQILRVSPEIIEALRLHSLRTENSTAEVDLARNMFEDFSRFPISTPAPTHEQSSSTGTTTNTASDNGGAIVIPDTAHTASASVSSESGNEEEDQSAQHEIVNQPEVNKTESGLPNEVDNKVQYLNDIAKQFLLDARYEAAIEKYQESLNVEEDNTQTLTNIATVYWKRATESATPTTTSAAQNELRVIRDLEQCVEYCDRALLVTPTLMKSSYRKAKAQEALDETEEALATLERVLERNFASRTSNNPQRTLVEKFAKQLRQTLGLAGKETKNKLDASATFQDMLDDEESIINSILKRTNLDSKSSTNSSEAAVEQQPKQTERTVKGDNTSTDKITSTNNLKSPTLFKRFSDLENLLTINPESAVDSLCKLGGPNDFQKLFKESLSEEVLVAIFSAMDTYMLPIKWESALKIVHGLTGVNRLQTIMMFLGEKELSSIRYVFSVINSAVKNLPDTSFHESLLASAKKFGVKL